MPSERNQCDFIFHEKNIKAAAGHLKEAPNERVKDAFLATKFKALNENLEQDLAELDILSLLSFLLPMCTHSDVEYKSESDLDIPRFHHDYVAHLSIYETPQFTIRVLNINRS